MFRPDIKQACVLDEPWSPGLGDTQKPPPARRPSRLQSLQHKSRSTLAGTLAWVPSPRFPPENQQGMPAAPAVEGTPTPPMCPVPGTFLPFVRAGPAVWVHRAPSARRQKRGLLAKQAPVCRPYLGHSARSTRTAGLTREGQVLRHHAHSCLEPATACHLQRLHPGTRPQLSVPQLALPAPCCSTDTRC